MGRGEGGEGEGQGGGGEGGREGMGGWVGAPLCEILNTPLPMLVHRLFVHALSVIRHLSVLDL